MNFNFLPHKSVLSNLILIKGIGYQTALRIIYSLGISKHTKYSELLPSTIDQLFHTLSYIRNISTPNNKFSPIEFNLDKYINSHISQIIQLHSQKSFRFLAGYPVRGQRTRSNAKTSRKFRKHN